MLCVSHFDRRGQTNEAANQDLYIPLLAPKLPPGRMYFLFGKPFRTAGIYESCT